MSKKNLLDVFLGFTVLLFLGLSLVGCNSATTADTTTTSTAATTTTTTAATTSTAAAATTTSTTTTTVPPAQGYTFHGIVLAGAVSSTSASSYVAVLSNGAAETVYGPDGAPYRIAETTYNIGTSVNSYFYALTFSATPGATVWLGGATDNDEGAPEFVAYYNGSYEVSGILTPITLEASTTLLTFPAFAMISNEAGGGPPE